MLQVKILAQKPEKYEEIKKKVNKGQFMKHDEMIAGFDLNEALRLFDGYTRGRGNLLEAKLVRFLALKSPLNNFDYQAYGIDSRMT